MINSNVGDIIYNFLNKKFVVTGASSGIGRQIVEELAQAGAIVLAMARREELLKELKNNYPDNIVLGVVDIENTAIMENMIKDFVADYGKLDGCVHAAGIDGFTPIRNFDRQLARGIMEINFWSGIELIRIVNKKVYSNNGFSNVLISSVAAYTGKKCMFAYSAAKAALQVATRSIAKEIGKNKHRINTISPGWVRTDMTNVATKKIEIPEFILNRHILGVGNTDDVSGVVVFLLSSKASWITGTDIVVDGGYLGGE